MHTRSHSFWPLSESDQRCQWVLYCAVWLCWRKELHHGRFYPLGQPTNWIHILLQPPPAQSNRPIISWPYLIFALIIRLPLNDDRSLWEIPLLFTIGLSVKHHWATHHVPLDMTTHLLSYSCPWAGLLFPPPLFTPLLAPCLLFASPSGQLLLYFIHHRWYSEEPVVSCPTTRCYLRRQPTQLTAQMHSKTNKFGATVKSGSVINVAAKEFIAVLCYFWKFQAQRISFDHPPTTTAPMKSIGK